jgi:hypothetical protein
MNVYVLETSWVSTADDRRLLHWELLASDEVRGVFLTAREDALAVLFAGDRHSFDAWTRTIERRGAFESGLQAARL